MKKEFINRYVNHLSERIENFGDFTSFGEDSIRYDFFISIINEFNLKPFQILLEQPIPDSQFSSKFEIEGLKSIGRGRNEYKPEVDLIINSNYNFSEGIVCEFAYFRKPEKTINQDKTGRHGKILNEIFRLSLMKHCELYKNHRCYLIVVTDEEMLNYGKEGTRGPSPILIQDEYELSENFLKFFKETALSKIENKFKDKAREFEIIPVANRIVNETYKFKNTKWGIWIWEINIKKQL